MYAFEKKIHIDVIALMMQVVFIYYIHMPMTYYRAKQIELCTNDTSL